MQIVQPIKKTFFKTCQHINRPSSWQQVLSAAGLTTFILSITQDSLENNLDKKLQYWPENLLWMWIWWWLCCVKFCKWCFLLLVLTQPHTSPSLEGFWAREQFRKIGNLNHYPLPFIYYVCNSGLKGGKINIVWKTNKFLCLHQSNNKGENQRESSKNPPRNRSCSVTHSMCSPWFAPLAETGIRTQLILANVVK